MYIIIASLYTIYKIIDRGDSGQVSVDGIGISNLNDDRLTDYRRGDVGFVFQFYNLVPNLMVGENIEVVSNISKSPLDTDDFLTAVGMKDKKHRFPRELSGGEQQRVSIARGIVELFGNEPLDIPENEQYKVYSIEDKISAIQNLMTPLTSTVIFIAAIAFIIGLIIIYVVTSMIVEENRSTISLMKIFGYRKKEVNSLILNSSTIIVVIGYILGILLSFASVGGLLKALENSLTFAMPVTINPLYVVFGFAVVMFSYELSKLFCRRKVFIRYPKSFQH